MATFYGTLQGCRGLATRLGSKDSGLKVSAQSYDGSVITKLSYNEKDELVISIELSDGSSCYGDRVFSGTLKELKEKLK